MGRLWFGFSVGMAMIAMCTTAADAAGCATLLASDDVLLLKAAWNSLPDRTAAYAYSDYLRETNRPHAAEYLNNSLEIFRLREGDLKAGWFSRQAWKASLKITQLRWERRGLWKDALRDWNGTAEEQNGFARAILGWASVGGFTETGFPVIDFHHDYFPVFEQVPRAIISGYDCFYRRHYAQGFPEVLDQFPQAFRSVIPALRIRCWISLQQFMQHPDEFHRLEEYSNLREIIVMWPAHSALTYTRQNLEERFTQIFGHPVTVRYEYYGTK